MSVHPSERLKSPKRITTHQIQGMKQRGEKITMLTAYDYSMAGIVDAAGTDIILVGDSASNVMAGHETTLPITLDQMIYHASSVVRAVQARVRAGGYSVRFVPGQLLGGIAIGYSHHERIGCSRGEGGRRTRDSRVYHAYYQRRGAGDGPSRTHSPVYLRSLEPTTCAPKTSRKHKSFWKTPNCSRSVAASAWCSKKCPLPWPSGCRKR